MFELDLDYVAENSSEKVIGSLKKYYGIISKKLASVVQNKSDKLSQKDIDFYSYLFNRLQNELNVAIDVERLENGVIDYSKIEKALEMGKELEIPVNFYICGGSKIKSKDNVSMLFTQKTLNNLIDVNNKLVESGENGLLFMEDELHPERCWNFQDVIFANKKIDKIVAYIKKKEFSPFEALTYIHQYIASKFNYKEDKNNLINSRSIVGCLNSDKIVCAGYAKLIKAIIDKLNMPGLECDVLNSLLYQPDGTEEKDEKGIAINLRNMTAHAQNMIKINDPKYKIRGKYITDACWDSAPTFLGGNKKSIATLLFPVEDLNNLAQFIFFHPRKQDVFNYLVVSSKDNIQQIVENTNKFFDKNVKKSTLIDIESYKKSLESVYSKINPKLTKEDVQDIVDEIMENTFLASYEVFGENAIGTLSQEAQKMYAIDPDSLKDEDLFKELERLFSRIKKNKEVKSPEDIANLQPDEQQDEQMENQQNNEKPSTQDNIDNIDEEMESDEFEYDDQALYNFLLSQQK